MKAKMKRATLRRQIEVACRSLSIFQFDLAEDFHFTSGQYVTLGLDTETDFLPRHYSIASSPYDSKSLEFYINVLDDGEFSPHLFALKPGQPIWYAGPKGRFTLERSAKKNIFMIATGTGLAPFISMIRKLEADGKAGEQSEYNLVVMHGVSHSQDLGYRFQLEAWSRQKSLRLQYLPAISRPDKSSDLQLPWARGRVNDLVRYFLGESQTGAVEPRPGEEVNVQAITELLRREPAFYLCGNPGMIADIRGVLVKHGFTEILTEDC
ncbi:MAG: hypothetical protein HY644_14820 [Acidobacteria bacterium]|nr:hypothetical protein [Acidobacteriota bacterium]